MPPKAPSPQVVWKPCTPSAPSPQEWFTTEEAAVYLRTTAKALIQRIGRGTLVPDSRGQRGRGRQHMFRRATLDAHYTNSGE